MANLSDFKMRLSRLSSTKDVADETLDDFIDAGLIAFSEYKSEKVLLKKVPVDTDANGIYAVPTDALSIVSVFVHGTDREIHFEVERDASTGVRQLHLGGIEHPQWIFVAGPVAYPNYGVDENTFRSTGRLGGGSGGYDFFDILYFRTLTMERLTSEDADTVQLYVEYLGYLEKAGEPENLVDIRESYPSGDATEIKQSGRGKQFLTLAALKKEAFEKRVISPYGVRDTTGQLEYLYGEHLLLG